MGKHSQSVDSRILRRICAKRRGFVFCPKAFSDLGTRDAVASALKRYKRVGIIRQIARGLYDYPNHDRRFGLLSPSTDQIAQALAHRDAANLQPTGAYAANLLGLSDQVPVKTVFLTDGPSRHVTMGRKREIILRHTTTRNMAAAGTTSGLVIQALRWLGRRHVDDRTISILRSRLPEDERRRLLKYLLHAPAWVADIMRQVAQPGEG
jgi:hypothetical protein